MLGKMINEPLRHFVEKHGVDLSTVEKIVCGRKYSGVLLKNGNIGVCANLLNEVKVEKADLSTPDLDRIDHRIILNAYFNATLNYINHYEESADIFDGIDFTNYEKIVMVGLFRPILEKFKMNNIKIHVFDLIKTSGELAPIKNEMEYVKKADAIILSATSIANGTFMEIVTHSRESCDIFPLGPSSILSKEMFEYRNIKSIFGSIFKSHDENVLNTIKNGYGTRAFLKFGRKVSL
jgi:uncharacterized protein (DUF4213/DUF364 family)